MKKRILIVEDQHDNRQILRDLLVPAGFELIEGWDGEALLGAITCPTLLLQGATQMGGLMSDADVAIAIRLLPHHAHVKFKNLGHALFIQQPEPVLRAVTNFLESL